MNIHVIACAREFERPARPVTSRFRGDGVANLSLPHIASLVPAGHAVAIQDERVAPLKLSASIDLVLMSVKSCFAPRAFEIAARLRTMGVPVVMGGCHPTINPDECLEHADAVVVGEAESVFDQLIIDAEKGVLRGRYVGEPLPMNGLPLPRRDLLQKDYLLDAIIVSRGCNHNCRFCCISDLYGPGFRARPVGEVVAEAKTLGPRLGFHDENLVGDLSFGRELFEGLRPLKREFFAQVSTDILREPDLIELAARAGARGFLIGLESVNEANLKSVGKLHNNIDAYAELVERCRHHGILVAPGIVFGFDHDTPDVFARTLQALKRLKVDVCLFKVLTPYPGTPFFRDLDKQGRILNKDWSFYDGHFPTFSPAGMSVEELFEGVDWIRKQFYSHRAILGRLGQYAELKMSIWATILFNYMIKGAYGHVATYRDDLLKQYGGGDA